MGRITTSVKYAKIANPNANGTCSPMPSFRQISASRSAHEMNEPSAQIVTSCQIPPSSNGANDSPYFCGGGFMLSRNGFQVGPIATPQRMSETPTTMKKIVVTPKNPT